MARTAPDTTKRHLQPRSAILGGAALGLVVGATVYGAVSSSADSALPQAFKAKAPVTVAPVIAPACTGKAKLEKGVCVVHVVRTVMAPVAAAAPVVGQLPTSTHKPATAARAAAVAPKTSVAAKVPAASTVAHTRAPVPSPVAAVAPTAKTARTTAPAPAAKPTSTPVPTAAS